MITYYVVSHNMVFMSLASISCQFQETAVSPGLFSASKETFMNQTPYNYQGDDALSTKPEMLIWAPLVLATRWSCSQQALLSAGGRLQLHLVAGIRGAQISTI